MMICFALFLCLIATASATAPTTSAAADLTPNGMDDIVPMDILELFDTDVEGAISKDAFIGGILAMAEPELVSGRRLSTAKKMAEALKKKIDANKNGKLSHEEIKKVFRGWDKDNDKKLDKEEIEAAVKEMGLNRWVVSKAKAIIKEFDKNKDGKLDSKEFKAAAKKAACGKVEDKNQRRLRQHRSLQASCNDPTDMGCSDFCMDEDNYFGSVNSCDDYCLSNPSDYEACVTSCVLFPFDAICANACNTCVCPLSGPCPCDKCDSGVCGDPHFKTWTGEWYDYQGECELMFLHAPNFGKGVGLDIHIQTKIQHGYSYIESVAIKIGDDVLEVGSWGEAWLNDVELPTSTSATANVHMPFRMGPFPFTHESTGRAHHTFDISVGGKDRDWHIVVKVFKQWVSIQLGNPHREEFVDSTGMLGSYPSAGMIARDGETVIADPNEFGQEWQVLPEEGHLFQSVRAPSYPQKCKLPKAPAVEDSRQLEAMLVSVEEAKEACAHWESFQDFCVKDVMATGDLEMAQWQAGVFLEVGSGQVSE